MKSNSFVNIGGIDPRTGLMLGMARVGSAVHYTKMLATPTGDMMREYLNRDVQFSWDTESQQKIDAAKEEIKNNLEKLEELGEQVMKEQQEAGEKQPDNSASASVDSGTTAGTGAQKAGATDVKPNQDGSRADTDAGKQSGAGNSPDGGAQTSAGAQENDVK